MQTDGGDGDTTVDATDERPSSDEQLSTMSSNCTERILHDAVVQTVHTWKTDFVQPFVIFQRESVTFCMTPSATNITFNPQYVGNFWFTLHNTRGLNFSSWKRQILKITNTTQFALVSNCAPRDLNTSCSGPLSRKSLFQRVNVWQC